MEWLSLRTNHRYRLPSESEWEFAARAGSTKTRYWGSRAEKTCKYANGADKATLKRLPDIIGFKCNDGYVYTNPVGSFKANAFGLYDMIGDAWEWTEDCWNETYDAANGDSAPVLSGDCRATCPKGNVGQRTEVPTLGTPHQILGTIVDVQFFRFRVARSLE